MPKDSEKRSIQLQLAEVSNNISSPVEMIEGHQKLIAAADYMDLGDESDNSSLSMGSVVCL